MTASTSTPVRLPSSHYKMPQPDLPVILQHDLRGLLTIEDEHLELLQLTSDGKPPRRMLKTPLQKVLRLHLLQAKDNPPKRVLNIHVLLARDKTSKLRLTKLHVLVDVSDDDKLREAERWVDEATKACYPHDGVGHGRRVLIIVNPIGGKGKGRSIVKETVLPILEAAGCVVEVIETRHRLHAEEIAHALPLTYDVIASASGDGLAYEILNGLASRPDARRALKIAVAPIPTGSANALAINLFGVEDTFNIHLACLNIIKGQLLPLDLSSVTSPSFPRRFSFLSQATGLMVDLDIGTENLRWLGDTRFIYGFVRGAVANRPRKVRVQMRVVEGGSDKVHLARVARELAGEVKAFGGGTLAKGMEGLRVDEAPGFAATGKANTEDVKAKKEVNETEPAENNFLPMPKVPSVEPDDSWVTITSQGKSTAPAWKQGEGILYINTGSMPYVSRDLMQWPVTTQGHGTMDVVIQTVVARATLVGAITGAEKGQQYWMECQHYYKCSAYTVENLEDEELTMTIDGESFPFTKFQVEVHAGAARTLSLTGKWKAFDFKLEKK